MKITIRVKEAASLPRLPFDTALVVQGTFNGQLRETIPSSRKPHTGAPLWPVGGDLYWEVSAADWQRSKALNPTLKLNILQTKLSLPESDAPPSLSGFALLDLRSIERATAGTASPQAEQRLLPVHFQEEVTRAGRSNSRGASRSHSPGNDARLLVSVSLHRGTSLLSSEDAGASRVRVTKRTRGRPAHRMRLTKRSLNASEASGPGVEAPLDAAAAVNPRLSADAASSSAAASSSRAPLGELPTASASSLASRPSARSAAAHLPFLLTVTLHLPAAVSTSSAVSSPLAASLSTIPSSWLSFKLLDTLVQTHRFNSIESGGSGGGGGATATPVLCSHQFVLHCTSFDALATFVAQLKPLRVYMCTDGAVLAATEVPLSALADGFPAASAASTSFSGVELAGTFTLIPSTAGHAPLAAASPESFSYPWLQLPQQLLLMSVCVQVTPLLGALTVPAAASTADADVRSLSQQLSPLQRRGQFSGGRGRAGPSGAAAAGTASVSTGSSSSGVSVIVEFLGPRVSTSTAAPATASVTPPADRPLPRAVTRHGAGAAVGGDESLSGRTACEYEQQFSALSGPVSALQSGPVSARDDEYSSSGSSSANSVRQQPQHQRMHGRRAPSSLGRGSTGSGSVGDHHTRAADMPLPTPPTEAADAVVGREPPIYGTTKMPSLTAPAATAAQHAPIGGSPNSAAASIAPPPYAQQQQLRVLGESGVLFMTPLHVSVETVSIRLPRRRSASAEHVAAYDDGLCWGAVLIPSTSAAAAPRTDGTADPSSSVASVSVDLQYSGRFKPRDHIDAGAAAALGYTTELRTRGSSSIALAASSAAAATGADSEQQRSDGTDESTSAPTAAVAVASTSITQSHACAVIAARVSRLDVHGFAAGPVAAARGSAEARPAAAAARRAAASAHSATSSATAPAPSPSPNPSLEAARLRRKAEAARRERIVRGSTATAATNDDGISAAGGARRAAAATTTTRRGGVDGVEWVSLRATLDESLLLHIPESFCPAAEGATAPSAAASAATDRPQREPTSATSSLAAVSAPPSLVDSTGIPVRPFGVLSVGVVAAIARSALSQQHGSGDAPASPVLDFESLIGSVDASALVLAADRAAAAAADADVGRPGRGIVVLVPLQLQSNAESDGGRGDSPHLADGRGAAGTLTLRVRYADDDDDEGDEEEGGEEQDTRQQQQQSVGAGHQHYGTTTPVEVPFHGDAFPLSFSSSSSRPPLLRPLVGEAAADGATTATTAAAAVSTAFVSTITAGAAASAPSSPHSVAGSPMASPVEEDVAALHAQLQQAQELAHEVLRLQQQQQAHEHANRPVEGTSLNATESAYAGSFGDSGAAAAAVAASSSSHQALAMSIALEKVALVEARLLMRLEEAEAAASVAAAAAVSSAASTRVDDAASVAAASSLARTDIVEAAAAARALVESAVAINDARAGMLSAELEASRKAIAAATEATVALNARAAAAEAEIAYLRAATAAAAAAAAASSTQRATDDEEGPPPSPRPSRPPAPHNNNGAVAAADSDRDQHSLGSGMLRMHVLSLSHEVSRLKREAAEAASAAAAEAHAAALRDRSASALSALRMAMILEDERGALEADKAALQDIRAQAARSMGPVSAAGGTTTMTLPAAGSASTGAPIAAVTTGTAPDTAPCPHPPAAVDHDAASTVEQEVLRLRQRRRFLLSSSRARSSAASATAATAASTASTSAAPPAQPADGGSITTAAGANGAAAAAHITASHPAVVAIDRSLSFLLTRLRGLRAAEGAPSAASTAGPPSSSYLPAGSSRRSHRGAWSSGIGDDASAFREEGRSPASRGGELNSSSTSSVHWGNSRRGLGSGNVRTTSSYSSSASLRSSVPISVLVT